MSIKKTLKFRFCLMTLRLSKKLNFRFCLMTSCLCSGMIACACGMGEWSVECECVCRWMVSGWNECDCVEQAPAPGSMQHRLKTELFSVAMRHIYIYIYYHRSVWERDQRDEWEKTGINSVCLEDCFWLRLAWMDRKDTNNKQPTAHFPTTLHL